MLQITNGSPTTKSRVDDKHIEKKIADCNYAPDAVIGEIKEKALSFSNMVCTKTVYNMIDRGAFCRITNQKLTMKKKQNV